MTSINAVSLRRMRPEDALTFADWAQDPAFCREAEWNTSLSRDDHVSFWRVLIENPPTLLLRLSAVMNGELIGYVDLHGEEEHGRELGFTIGDSTRWGLGLGRKAALAGLDYGFNQMGLTEIWAESASANTRSVRILKRIGMDEIEQGAAVNYLGQQSFYRRFKCSSPG